MGIRCPTSKLLVRSQPNGRAALRLFCFPYAGGSASAFRSWSSYLPASIEVCAIQPPGRGNLWKEPPYTRLDELVRTLVEVLPPYLDLPFAFFGYSVGALVSFELARQLAKQYALHPVHLFVASCRAPQLVRSDVSIHDLPGDAFLEGLRHFKGISEHILQDAATMDFLLPTLRADFALYETYRYVRNPTLDCPLSVYGGLQDAQVSRSDLKPWQDVANGRFALQMFPGDHFFLRSARDPLLQAMTNDLLGFLN